MLRRGFSMIDDNSLSGTRDFVLLTVAALGYLREAIRTIRDYGELAWTLAGRATEEAAIPAASVEHTWFLTSGARYFIDCSMSQGIRSGFHLDETEVARWLESKGDDYGRC